MNGFTDAQLLAAYQQAPKAIQEALDEGCALDFMMKLQGAYQLHIDAAGTIAGLIRDILLGLRSPTELTQRMQELGLPPEISERLLADLNHDVFSPLHDQILNPSLEKGSGSDEGSTAIVPPPHTVPSLSSAVTHAEMPHVAPAVSSAPAPTEEMPPIAGASVPTASAAPVFVPPTPPAPSVSPVPVPHVEQSIPVAPTHPTVPPVAAPSPAMPAPMPPVAAPAPAPVPTPSFSGREEHPAMRTMASDMQAVKEHRMPEPLFSHAAPASAPPPPIVPPPVVPPPLPPTRQMPPPPANLPGAPVVKKYGVDPYREPVE